MTVSELIKYFQVLEQSGKGDYSVIDGDNFNTITFEDLVVDEPDGEVWLYR